MSTEPAVAVPALRPEGTIALIAPAGPAELDAEKAAQWVRNRGYNLRIFPGVFERDGYLAGSDDTRLNDLHGAFADPDIDAIFCLRRLWHTTPSRPLGLRPATQKPQAIRRL